MKFFYFLKTLLFLLIIFLPQLGKWSGIDSLTEVTENRNLAERPSLSMTNLDGFSNSFSKYFNDSFGFRPDLVKANNYLKVKYLGVSRDPGITLGKNGWFFYTPELTLAEMQSLNLFSQSELQQIVVNLDRMQAHFNDGGAEFYFLIAPTSQSIYPEYLPDNLRGILSNSRLDQLSTYLRQSETKVNFINPKPQLYAGKNLGQLYYKYDLHWTTPGAFLAYQQLANLIAADFPQIKPLSTADYLQEEILSQKADLINLAGLTSLFQENETIFKPKFSPQAQVISDRCRDIYNRCDELTTVIDNPDLPQAIIYRDSYASWLIPFLSEHFREAVYIWKSNPLYTDIVTEKKPDIVILELSERSSWTLTTRIFDFQ